MWLPLRNINFLTTSLSLIGFLCWPKIQTTLREISDVIVEQWVCGSGPWWIGNFLFWDKMFYFILLSTVVGMLSVSLGCFFSPLLCLKYFFFLCINNLLRKTNFNDKMTFFMGTVKQKNAQSMTTVTWLNSFKGLLPVFIPDFSMPFLCESVMWHFDLVCLQLLVRTKRQIEGFIDLLRKTLNGKISNSLCYTIFFPLWSLQVSYPTKTWRQRRKTAHSSMPQILRETL